MIKVGGRIFFRLLSPPFSSASATLLEVEGTLTFAADPEPGLVDPEVGPVAGPDAGLLFNMFVVQVRFHPQFATFESLMSRKLTSE